MDSMSWDYILKYVIVGDSSVGKTSLLTRLTDDVFAPTEPTLGVEFGSRIIAVEGGKRVKVQCWDTAGTESFRSITRSYFRGAAGALLVYDVTRRETFEHAASWLADLRAHADENVSIILIGNKTDLCSSIPPDESPLPASPPNEDEDAHPSSADPPENQPPQPNGSLRPRAVTTLEASLFAKQNNLLFLETSAKEGWGVVKAFERTAREVLRRVDTTGMLSRSGDKPGVNLKSQRSKGGCC